MNVSPLSEILEKLKSPETLSKGWLIKRLKKLTPQDFSTVMEFMAQEAFLPLLSAISKDFSLSFNFRLTALEIRKKLDDKIAPDEASLLREEQAIRKTLFNHLTTAGLEKSPSLNNMIDKLANLPEPLARTILQDVVKEKGKAGLPFLMMVYQNSADNYALTALEVLANIIAPETKKILREIAAKGKDKSSQKFAKKLLYRLREIDFPSEIGEQEIKAPTKTILAVPDYNIIKKAWASFIDGPGNRIIHLLKSQPMAQMGFITLLLSDTQGIMDCQAVAGSKKTISSMMDEPIKTKQVIEIPPSYAVTLIAECQEINKRAGRELPKGFVTNLGYILTKKAESEQKPLIYQEVATEVLNENPYFLNRSLTLLDLEEFNSWLVPSAELEGYLSKLREIEHSLIIVSEYLQRERTDEVYREVVREFFSPEKRALYRRRLEEMAYFLWATERQEEARFALAAALGFEDMEGDKILEHPFARQMVYRSIEAVRH